MPLAILLPAAVVERCKVLEVQYVLKELQQPPGMQSRRQQQQQHGVQPSRQQTEEDEELQDGQQRHTPRSPGDDSVEEPDEEPICQCLSVRVVLQRLPAAPPPDECEQPAAPSTWEQKGLEGHGETSQQAYTATFEYPAFTLKVGLADCGADMFGKAAAPCTAVPVMPSACPVPPLAPCSSSSSSSNDSALVSVWGGYNDHSAHQVVHHTSIHGHVCVCVCMYVCRARTTSSQHTCLTGDSAAGRAFGTGTPLTCCGIAHHGGRRSGAE